MLCCRRQADEYELNEEDTGTKNKENGKAKTAGKKKGDNDKVNDQKAGEGLNEVNEVVEAPIEITVTEATENEPKLELSLDKNKKAENQTESGTSKGDDSQASPDGTKGGNPNSHFASQMSITSQTSLREDIYRSREKFFTGSYPLDESLSQGDRKSICSTDERFAFHSHRIRSQLASAIKKPLKEEDMSAEEMKAVVDRLESVAMRLESLASIAPPKPSGGSQPDVVAPFVVAFDAMLSGNFAKYLELSNKIGGDVQTQAKMVEAAFKATREILVVASKSKKPEKGDLAGILKPVSDQISAIQQFREDNRKSKQFNHLSGISESIPALGWVAVEPTPKPYVKDMQDAGTFFTNRVLKEFKGQDGDDCEWTKKWNGALTEMQEYIKEYHLTGLTWNPQGCDAKSAPAPAAGGAPPPPPPGGAPPPPPPPPAVEAPSGGGGGSVEDDGRANLFASINKGTDITSGLKKVTKDMQTHKNPNLRAQTQTTGVRAGPAPFKAANTAPKPAPKPTAPVVKPPVFELQDKKWVVEFHIGNKGLVISETNPKQVIYIYKCVDSLVQVKGKVNSIVVDSCKKTAVVFDDTVSAVEFINSQSVQAQVNGKCPTVSIDKTDGCMVYLSKDSLSAEIVSAKSSEMNILVPNPKDEQDYIEFPLPEQFKSVWNGKKFTTDCTESI